MTTVVGLYSLNRANLGDCYATYRYHTLVTSVGDLANPRVQPREQRGVRVSVPDLPAPAGGADQQDQQDHLPQPHGQAAHGAGQWQHYRAGPYHDIIVFRCSASSFLATLTSEED